jgi:hypothetical protein
MFSQERCLLLVKTFEQCDQVLIAHQQPLFFCLGLFPTTERYQCRTVQTQPLQCKLACCSERVEPAVRKHQQMGIHRIPTRVPEHGGTWLGWPIVSLILIAAVATV